MTNIILLLQTIVALLTAIQSHAIPFEIKTQALNLSVQAVELVQQSIAPPLVFGKISLPKLDKANLQLKYDNAPKAIKDKYKLNGAKLEKKIIKNAELDKYKGEPKDEIEVSVGGDVEFEPKIKMSRWNEVDFTLKLKDTETGDESLTFDNDKIKWSKGNIDIEHYDYEDGYKMVWYLKKKPKTNKVEFTIDSKGLDFFYQPELTQEEIDAGAFRPENVVGSYAVYHSTKGGMNDINGKDYKVGKAFHIYRPHLIDANGLEAWGILNIENGIYSVEIPQDFLDNAVYPIKSNDNWGYTTAGGTTTFSLHNMIAGSLFTSPADMGTVTTMTAWIRHYNAGLGVKYGIYLHSDLSNKLGGNSFTLPNRGAWTTEEILNNVADTVLSASTGYILVAWASTNVYDIKLAYDAGDANQGHHQALTYGTWPNPLVPTHTTNKFSIYATYTAAGGGAVAPPAMQVIIIE